MYVGDVTKGGSIAANTIRNNCAGMFFEADQFDEHVVGFEVRANTVEEILARVEPRNSTGMSRGRHRASWRGEWHGAYGQPPLGQRPLWPHPCLWGGRSLEDPYFKKEQPKPMNNSVIGNHFGPNKPDIFWDETGSGDSFAGNAATLACPAVCATREVLLLTMKAPLRRGFRLRNAVFRVNLFAFGA